MNAVLVILTCFPSSKCVFNSAVGIATQLACDFYGLSDRCIILVLSVSNLLAMLGLYDIQNVIILELDKTNMIRELLCQFWTCYYTQSDVSVVVFQSVNQSIYLPKYDKEYYRVIMYAVITIFSPVLYDIIIIGLYICIFAFVCTLTMT